MVVKLMILAEVFNVQDFLSMLEPLDMQGGSDNHQYLIFASYGAKDHRNTEELKEMVVELIVLAEVFNVRDFLPMLEIARWWKNL